VKLYLAPALTAAKIGRAIFCNIDTNPHTITANIGAAASSANEFIAARQISPGETYVSPELAGAVIPPASAIWANAEAASAVVFSVSGVTIA
jgi:hypothetical protein